MDATLYEMDGKAQTLKAWADEYGVKYTTLRHRVKVQGWELPKALALAPRAEQAELTMWGRTQPITAWAEELAISAATIRKRLAKGMTTRRALLEPLPEDEAIYSMDGQAKTLIDWAAGSDAPLPVVRKRLADGWSLYKALTWPWTPAPPKAPPAPGTAAAIAQGRGVNPTTLRVRRHRGWTDARAATTPARPKGGPYTYRGLTQPLKDWAEQYGLAVTTILSRLKRGWEIGEALTTPPGQPRPRKE